MWLPELEQMIVVSPWSSLSPGLDGSRHSEELVCALIPLFIQFVSAPQWPTFSSVEHRSLNPCWCFPACFQTQMSGEWRGSDVEEWARAVCTEFVPTKPGVKLDVPGGNGKLCLAVQGWKWYLPASPASKLLCRNVSASLAPVPVSLFSAQLRHLSHARGPLLGACSGQGDSGRGTVAGGQWQRDSGHVPTCLAEVCGFGVLGCLCCRRIQSHPWPCCPAQHRRAISSE